MLRSGRRVVDALRERRYRVAELDADERLVEALRDGQFDVAFLALHGRLGEDGTVASILDLLGLPYIGSSFDASRLAFDKLASESVLRRAGLSVPRATPLAEGALRELGVGALLDRALDELGLPLVVKPNRGGPALGVRLVERAGRLPAALMAAFGYDDTVLLEQRVAGIELVLAVVDGLPALPAVEIRQGGPVRLRLALYPRCGRLPGPRRVGRRGGRPLPSDRLRRPRGPGLP